MINYVIYRNNFNVVFKAMK